MLSQKHDPFINLKENRKDMPEVPTAGSGVNKKPEPRGPVVYIHNIDLPLSIEDLNISLTAEIKITPREIRTTVTNDKKETSYDLEITGIRFKS